MEYEKKTAAQSNLYPTAPTGAVGYETFQSPTPGGVAYPQAPPQQPAYPQTDPSTYPHQPYGYPAPGSVSYAQPPQMVIMPQTVVVAQPSGVSMVAAIVLSCCSLWCCCVITGLVAFILAMVGQSKSSEGKVQSAIRLRNASYGVSIVGIVLGIIFAIIVIVVLVQHYFTKFADRPV